MDKPIKFEFTLTRPELNRAFQAFAVRGPAYRIAAIVLPITFLAVCITASFTAAMPILAIAVGSYLAVAFLPVTLWRSSPLFREPQKFVANDDELVLKAATGEARMPWNFFKNVITTSHFFLLCKSRRFFVIIPRRAFGNPEEEKRFSELLASKELT